MHTTDYLRFKVLYRDFVEDVAKVTVTLDRMIDMIQDEDYDLHHMLVTAYRRLEAVVDEVGVVSVRLAVSHHMKGGDDLHEPRAKG